MRILLVLVLTLVACNEPAPMGPDALLERMSSNGITMRYAEGMLSPPYMTDGPNRIMSGALRAEGGIDVTATMFAEAWMARYTCQPKPSCFRVGHWAVWPRLVSGLTDSQQASWQQIQTKMQ